MTSPADGRYRSLLPGTAEGQRRIPDAAAGGMCGTGGWRAIVGGLIGWVGGSQTVVAWWLPMAGS